MRLARPDPGGLFGKAAARIRALDPETAVDMMCHLHVSYQSRQHILSRWLGDVDHVFGLALLQGSAAV